MAEEKILLDRFRTDKGDLQIDYNTAIANRPDLENLNYARVQHDHTPEEIGAAKADHTHEGIAGEDHTHKPEDIGAIPKTGGDVEGDLKFTGANGFQWTTESGTVIEVEPNVKDDTFQVAMTPSGGNKSAVFSVNANGEVVLKAPLAVESGGTGANGPEEARSKLDAAQSDHHHDYAAGEHTHTADEIIDGALSIERGGTSASDPATARQKLEITPYNIGAVSASYSTEEVLTGGTWIDGKPTYRKVVPITATTNTYGAVAVELGSDIDQIVSLTGCTYNDTYRGYYPLTFSMNGAYHTIYVLTDANTGIASVHYITSFEFTCDLIIEYTKKS